MGRKAGEMFQSTLPVWGGTQRKAVAHKRFKFQSTLPVWGGTFCCILILEHSEVSIHPPRVGRDPDWWESDFVDAGFQSTLPVWGGTHGVQDMRLGYHVSIHPPRVGRDSKSSQKFFLNFCARRQYYQNF